MLLQVYGYKTVMLLTVLTLFGISACSSRPSKPDQNVAGPVEKVVVRKAARTIELQNQRGQVMRQYRTALGGSPIGHKYREGDQRTPEGRYVFNWRKPNSQFYKAMHISYPNSRDQENSRKLGYSPGGMIMLHGLPNYIQSEGMRKSYKNRDWTHGCIAVQNHEIDEIWKLVPDGTPIEILP